jgi:hypothetical protein
MYPFAGAPSEIIQNICSLWSPSFPRTLQLRVVPDVPGFPLELPADGHFAWDVPWQGL